MEGTAPETGTQNRERGNETAPNTCSTRTTTTITTSPLAHRRKIYLVIFNISKRPNVRSLLCTAAAFGCYGVFVVGQRNFDLDPDGKDIPTPIKDYIRRGNSNTGNGNGNGNGNNTGGGTTSGMVVVPFRPELLDSKHS